MEWRVRKGQRRHPGRASALTAPTRMAERRIDEMTRDGHIADRTRQESCAGVFDGGGGADGSGDRSWPLRSASRRPLLAGKRTRVRFVPGGVAGWARAGSTDKVH